MINMPTPTPTPTPARRPSAEPGGSNGQTAGCSGCTARWPISTGIAHCSRCHATFASVSSFDTHRTGPIDRRRCLDEAELRGLGYAPNDRGRWRIPLDPAAAARLDQHRPMESHEPARPIKGG